MKSFCSSWQPSAKGMVVAASIASMAARGAFRPRCLVAALSRAPAKTAVFSAVLPNLPLRSRVFGAGLTGDFSRERDCSREEIALDDFIDDAEF